MHIATKHDLETYLADAATHDAALAHLQRLMDERYQFGPDGAWGIVEPNGLTRLGMTVADAVALGAVDREILEPEHNGPTLEDVSAAKLAAIQAEKIRARDAGFMVDGVLFDSDQSARISYAELALRLASDPTFVTPWKASAGAWVEMNAVKYAQVASVGGAHIQSVFAWQAARDAEVTDILAGEGTDTEKAEAIQAIRVGYELPG